jgi:thymidylate synthase (FAD)
MGVYKQIEKAARTAYKSEDKITDDSAPKMVEALCKSNHGACLEHGTIYLEVPMENGD